ncbi:hypothetical protein [Eisenibacter elegans]|uniref:hypothetical protein n=1 Tax=Eisenibacter elegans TaxID=997 RepID=UPI000402ED82|nr:hypothetical protein [Eisenibacter elegans]
MLEILGYYLTFLLLLLWSWGLGWVLCRWLRIQGEHTPWDAFLRISLGISVSITVFALLQTWGRTMMLGGLVALVLAYLPRKNDTQQFAQKPLKDELRQLSMAVFWGSVFFVLYAYLAQAFDTHWALPHEDYVFYAKAANHLLQTKTEGHLLQNLSNPSWSPYHYADLWLVAFCKYWSSRLLSLYHLVVVSFALLTLLYYLGLCSILQWLQIPPFYASALGFLSLWISCVWFPFYAALPLMAEVGVFTTTAWSMPKLLWIYVWVCAAVVFCLQREFRRVFYVLMILPFYYTPTAPAVFVSLGCWLLWGLYFQQINASAFVKKTLVLCLAAGFIGLFYYLLSPKVQSEQVGVIWGAGRTGVNIFVGSMFRLGVLYLPFVLVGWLCLPKQIMFGRQVWAFYGVFGWLCLSGLLAWAVFNKQVNALQFLTNVATPVLHIGCFMVLCYGFWWAASRSQQLLAGLVLGLSVGLGVYQFLQIPQRHQPYNPGYVSIVRKHMEGLPHHAGVAWKSPSSYATPLLAPDIITLGQHLNLWTDRAHITDLSVFDIPVDQPPGGHFAHVYRQALHASRFYKYVQAHQEETRPVAALQLDFIRQYKIQYGFVQASAELPPLIESYVRESYTDPVSGERLVLFR